jgi:hypothetical protein
VKSRPRRSFRRRVVDELLILRNGRDADLLCLVDVDHVLNNLLREVAA